MAASYRSPTAATSACVVKSDGTIWCWGNNRHGQLGAGLAEPGSEAPVQVVTSTRAPVTGAVRVSTSHAGSSFCAITEGGKVWCWGAGTEGLLGNGFKADSNVAVPVVLSSGGDPLTGAIDVSVGGDACVVRTDGTAWCWGKAQSALPQPVNILESVSAIACASSHCCAVGVKAGNLWCWGSYRPVATKLAFKDQRLVAGITQLTQGGTGLTALTTEQAVLTWDSGYDPVPAQMGSVALTTPHHLGEQCFVSGQGRHHDRDSDWTPFCD